MSAATCIFFASKIGYIEFIEGYIEIKWSNFQIKTIFYELIYIIIH